MKFVVRSFGGGDGVSANRLVGGAGGEEAAVVGELDTGDVAFVAGESVLEAVGFEFRHFGGIIYFKFLLFNLGTRVLLGFCFADGRRLSIKGFIWIRILKTFKILFYKIF